MVISLPELLTSLCFIYNYFAKDIYKNLIFINITLHLDKRNKKCLLLILFKQFDFRKYRINVLLYLNTHGIKFLHI